MRPWHEPGTSSALPATRASPLLRDRPLIREGAITPQVMTDLVDVIEPDRLLNRLDLPAGIAVGADLAIEWAGRARH